MPIPSIIGNQYVSIVSSCDHFLCPEDLAESGEFRFRLDLGALNITDQQSFDMLWHSLVDGRKPIPHTGERIVNSEFVWVFPITIHRHNTTNFLFGDFFALFVRSWIRRTFPVLWARLSRVECRLLWHLLWNVTFFHEGEEPRKFLLTFKISFWPSTLVMDGHERAFKNFQNF